MWQPSDKWQRRHTQDHAYRIVVHVPALTDAAWERLRTENEASDDRIDFGGVYLERLTGNEVAAVSGGEDAFDSLDYALNDMLREAAGDFTVVTEKVLD
ncbi:hypothetical protein J5O04_01130 [Corynebacterium hindlerae]|uniref:hypothetical protein n=1 Tax=Corynebacterium hindlerae TaxID=699041 RepID=UPI001AD68015|nr:hypothetical protein [Corynebacterium hindlerae]QTH59781.1 hypothetical protein J5O04_01130 [Corynebacterium hindlerae]